MGTTDPHLSQNGSVRQLPVQALIDMICTMPTQSLRQHMRRLRKQYSSQKQHLHATQAFKLIIEQTTWLQAAQHVACYLSNDGELSPKPLIQHLWQKNITCYLPVVDQHKTLRFAPYKQESPMKSNVFAMQEPNTPSVEAAQIDVMFIPLVAFDKKGQRLGRGQGYYDRTLAFKQNAWHNPPYLVGLAHSCQQVEELGQEPWDIPLDAVVTEKTVHLMEHCL